MLEFRFPETTFHKRLFARWHCVAGEGKYVNLMLRGRYSRYVTRDVTPDVPWHATPRAQDTDRSFVL